MNFFVKIIGFDEIDSDIRKQTAKMQKQIPLALSEVAFKMKANLEQHIISDWYGKQKPKFYERRTDDPRLGTPIGSESNMQTEISEDTLFFSYEPTGEHMLAAWHERDGDELISAIQEGNPIGMLPRPFWNNFAEEQMEFGIIEAFIFGMKPYAVIADGNDVVADGDEKL